MKLPDEIQVRQMSPSRAITSPGRVNYGGAQSAMQANFKAKEGFGDAVMDADKERLAREERDAALVATEKELKAKKDYLDLMYGTAEKEGLYARSGKNALSMEQDYEKADLEIKNRAMEGVTNPVVREKLQTSLDSLGLSNLSNVKSKVATERLSYTKGIAQSTIDMAAERVGLEYNNDEIFNQALGDAEKAALALSKLEGSNDYEGVQKIIDAKSGLYRARIGALLNKDDPTLVLQAEQFYKKALEAGNLNLKDQQDIDASLKAVLPKAKAYEEFNSFSQGGGIQDRPIDELFAGQLIVESGGKHIQPDGSITTSSAGAKGIAQLMPGTAKEMAKELGIDPSAWLNEDVNAYLGKAYLQKMKNKFGDNTLALLSYNWGPGNVQNHIEKVGDPRTGEISMDYFLASVPSDEARQYVPKVMKAAGIGNGRLDVGRADKMALGMEETQGKEFLALVKKQNAMIDLQENEVKKTAIDEVYEFVKQNRGVGEIILPNNLLIQAEKAGVGPEITSYKGETTPEMASMLYSLDPKSLQEFDLDSPAIRMSLSPEDYDRWKEKQKKLDDPAIMYNEELRNKMVYRAFEKRGMGIKNPTDKERVVKNDFNELLDVSIAAFTAEKGGRSPNGAEIQKLIDDLFIEKSMAKGGRGFSNFYGAFNRGNIAVYEMPYEDIPKKEREAISEKLRSKGFAVTEKMVILTYMKQFEDVPTEE